MVSATASAFGANNIGRIINAAQATSLERSNEGPTSRSQNGDNPLEQNNSSTVQAVEQTQSSSSNFDPSGQNLTPDEQRQVRELQQRDREVRAHEQAHVTAGGPYTSPPTYDTVTGPDGRQYAVGGEVQIDTSAENTPEETIRKMEIVIRAALAPAEPSPQDRQVAQQARQVIIQARLELQQQQQEEQQGDNDTSSPLDEITQESIRPEARIQQAIEGFSRAEQAANSGRTNPIEVSNDQGDSVDISDEAAQVIAALFGSQ